MELAMLKSYCGKMNLFVHPSAGFNMPVADTADSMERILVVPTAQTFRLLDKVDLLSVSLAEAK